MLLTQQLTFLALASTILAAPWRVHRKQNQDNQLAPGCVRQGRVLVCTVTVTAERPFPTSQAPVNNAAPVPTPVPSSAPAPAPAPQPSSSAAPAPAPAPKPSSSSAPAPKPSASSAPAPAPAPAGGASGGQGDYMATVSQMRSAGGLPPLTQDTQLEANARKTASDINGGALKHELNPGSFAQVLATGQESTFRTTYIQSWLCEIPSLPGLNGQCDRTTNSDETGHAEILTDPKRTKIGCAFVKGTWSCDLN